MNGFITCEGLLWVKLSTLALLATGLSLQRLQLGLGARR